MEMDGFKWKILLLIVFILMAGLVGAVRVYNNYECQDIRIDFARPANVTIFTDGSKPIRWIEANGLYLKQKDFLLAEEKVPFQARCATYSEVSNYEQS